MDLDDVGLAHDAFHQGDVTRCTAYLEAAIGIQPDVAGIQAAAVTRDTEPVTGAEPGNVLIAQPLDGVRNLTGGNLAALLVSILLIVADAGLALRTRRGHRTEA